MSIDAYARAHRMCAIDFLKLDVEGSEFDVLLGGADFFDSAPHLPIMQIEINRTTARAAGYTPEEMLEWLERKWGYSFHGVTFTGSLARISNIKKAGAASRDIMCIPPAGRARRHLRVDASRSFTAASANL
jgi:hypothetical protein